MRPIGHEQLPGNRCRRVEHKARAATKGRHARAGGVARDGDQPSTAPKQHTPPIKKRARAAATAQHTRAGGVTHEGDRPRIVPKQHTGRAASRTRAIGQEPRPSRKRRCQTASTCGRKSGTRGRAASHTGRSAKNRAEVTHTVGEQIVRAAVAAERARAHGVAHEGASRSREAK